MRDGAGQGATSRAGQMEVRRCALCGACSTPSSARTHSMDMLGPLAPCPWAAETGMVSERKTACAGHCRAERVEACFTSAGNT